MSSKISTLTTYSIHLGLVTINQLEAKLEALAHEWGIDVIQSNKEKLMSRISNLDEAEQRELEELNIMEGCLL